MCAIYGSRYECSRSCVKRIPVKRYFLPITAILGFTAYEELRDFVYLPLIVCCGFFVIFWNFPFLVYYTASRPLYYEDLFIDEKKLPNYDVNPKIKGRFQHILVWVLIITNTLLTGALSDYWLYKTKTAQSYIEVIGVTGGIIKIFQIINNTIGRLMLKILKGCVKQENRKFKQGEFRGIEKILKLKRVHSGLLKEMELHGMKGDVSIPVAEA